MKIILLIITILFATACTSYGPKNKNPNQYRAGIDLDDNVVTRPPEKVDLNQLAKNLNLSVPRHNLGLFEKSFNTCKAGAGFYEDYNCRTRYLSVLHFTVKCRNSNGTAVGPISQKTLKPLSHTNANWQLRKKRGRVRLDYQGAGEVLVVSRNSISNERFILKANGRYLGQRSKYVDKIVVPKEWCRP